MWIPYQRKAYGLGNKLGQKGVGLSFSNKDTIVSHIAGKKRKRTYTKGGVYLLGCKKNT